MPETVQDSLRVERFKAEQVERIEKTKAESTYRIEEFKSLRSEIDRRATDQKATERNVLLAAAAIYGAIIFRHIEGQHQPIIWLMWWLPPIFGVLGLARWFEQQQMIKHVAQYIEKRDPHGWESHLNEKRKHGTLTTTWIWYVVFWLVTICGTAALAYFETFQGSLQIAAIAIGFASLSAAMSGAIMVLMNPAYDLKSAELVLGFLSATAVWAFLFVVI
jgi:hypothetical protein